MLKRSLVKKIVEEKGNFLFTVKDNQENLKHNIQTALAKNTPKEYEEEVTKAHGRIEQRSIAVIDMPWEYNNEWQHIKQIACVTRMRQIKTLGKWQEPSFEKTYLITSHTASNCSPQQLLKMNREHWHIENKMHWVRDSVFREDQSTIHYSAKIMASCRNFAIFCLQKFFGKITESREALSYNPNAAIKPLMKTKFK